MKKLLLLLVSHVIVAILGFAAGIYALPILIAPESPSAADVQAMSTEAMFEGEPSKWAPRPKLDPFTGPLVVTIKAVYALPKGKYRKRVPRLSEPSQNAKDVDNIAKAVLDAGNGVLWVDDHQVWRLTVEKWQGAQDEAPHVEVVVTPSGGED